MFIFIIKILEIVQKAFANYWKVFYNKNTIIVLYNSKKSQNSLTSYISIYCVK